MDLLPQIDAQWKRLEEFVDEISQPEGSKFQTALSRTLTALDQISICFKRVNEGAIHRQELVERHCNQQDRITLAVHEEYHDINALLLSDIQTFFSMIKTYLNFLALFVKEVIPQSQLRGLRFKSFGSLVESAKLTVDNNDLPNKELREFIASRGAEFENKYVEYRDKQLEHPGKLADKSISSADGIPKIIHYDRRVNIAHENMGTNTGEIGIQEECITIVSPEGYEVTFFHIAPSEELELKSSISQGQPLGKPYDSTGLHFRKYGYHYHVFSSPEIDNSLIEKAAPGGALFASSPDPYEAILSLGKLTESLIRMVTTKQKDFNA